jgi:hypothetical protein
MTYTPNFADPRTQKRVIKAITFCKKYLREDIPQSLGNRWIYHKNNFGNQRNELSRYLREQLLICCDDRYNKDLKITKKYLLNKTGMELLEENLAGNNTIIAYSVVEVADQFQKELASGIEYKDSSDRLWHWLQHHKREEKRQIFHHSGFLHNYDIVCSAPTLLYQYSAKITPNKKPLTAIEHYIKHRNEQRQRLADECELDPQQVKKMLNRLFQGGQISAYTQSECYKELNGDRAKILFLQQDQFLLALRRDISEMWQRIKPSTQLRTKTDKLGRTRSVALTSKRKTGVYRELERQVLDSVIKYLNLTDNQFFTEHDGWITKEEIDRDELVSYIKLLTGFDVEIEYEQNCL